MPATEQTWYDQKLLHKVFAVSSLIMLIATVWMFAADHGREWKGVQRKFREVEQRLTTWRIRESETVEQAAELAALEEAKFQAETQPPPASLIGQFEGEVLADRANRGELDGSGFKDGVAQIKSWLANPAAVVDTPFKDINGPYADLLEKAEEAAGLRAAVAEKTKAARAADEVAAAAKKAVDDAEGSTRDVLKPLKRTWDQAVDVANDANRDLESARGDATKAAEVAAKLRTKVVGEMQSLYGKAKFREEQLLSKRKFRSADFDAARAKLDLAVRDNLPQAELDRLQLLVDEVTDGEGGLKEITQQRQDATAHRERLQELLSVAESDLDELDAKIEVNLAEQTRLNNQFKERRAAYFHGVLPGKKWLELPILDGFGSPLKIDNLWTDGLEHSSGSFGTVRRFDRCTTCHKGIAKTAAGTADKPAYVGESEVLVSMQTPSAEPAANDAGSLEAAYGIRLADYGLVNDDDVTVSFVAPGGLAAMADAESEVGPVNAGLQVGDVIEYVNGDKVLSTDDAIQFLTDSLDWGLPVQLTVRRGLPQPFTSHPRMDLFVGSLSPHDVAIFGCTSCHEGQGSATEFKFASHAPDSTAQEADWSRERGWFLNHHWIKPMYPARFAESACLKCHHEVAELDSSTRFPEAPAPKVIEGWNLIGHYGCYGCHEINGYDGPDTRVGPDLRLEPDYASAAAAVKADPGLSNTPVKFRGWVETVIQQPSDNSIRRQLRQYLLADAASEQPVLTAASHSMESILQDQDTPGQRRKAGPSLRYVGKKLDARFLYDWIKEPKNFRPDTKMPQFFGLWSHLDGADLEVAKKFEQVEILGIVAYLLNRSQPFDYLPPAEGVAAPSAERGKVAFELRGCLACHQHEDFPASVADQGPNLTHLADKFAGAPDGKAWLYSWVKKPTHYSARTKMPDLYLDPIEGADGTLTDPVADIVAYLTSSSRGWQAQMPEFKTAPEGLNDLALEHLSAAFPLRRAKEFLAKGIPADVGQTLKGHEVELVGGATVDKKLLYVGRRAIAKYGCYGCHDIPGFETAKPIGAALAEWGKKESSKIAFEHILEYLHHGHGHGNGHGDDHGAGHADGHHDSHGEDHNDHADHGGDAYAMSSHGDHDDDGHEYDPYYEKQLQNHDRSGFLWQKLKEPRSYDYKKTANKKYNDRLRMPKFPLTNAQREAIETFVLGLVAEPPAEKFVYRPDARGKAIAEGRFVLEKYNCGGCHVLRPETWEIAYDPDVLSAPPKIDDFPFVASRLSADDLAKSSSLDARRGTLHAILHGMPAISNDTAEPIVLDDEGDEIDPEEEYDPSTLQYAFDLWQPTAFHGETYEVGMRRLDVPAKSIKNRSPSYGGDLAKILLKRVLEVEKQDNPAANGTEAWGWLPPPLVGEGQKVQPEWLHAFLLEPYKIRPATFLRMPKFNMSPEEATKLVNYFAANDGAEYPFEFASQTSQAHLSAQQLAFESAGGAGDRFESAMKIVKDSNYCVKCHLVGEYVPESSERALAPNLADVQFRLKPDYVRRWIANPKRLLPYTPMPVNIPYVAGSETLGGVAQELYPGTSIDQVDALVDVLMNYSSFTGSKYKLAVGGAAPASTPSATPTNVPPTTDDEAEGQASRN